MAITVSAVFQIGIGSDQMEIHISSNHYRLEYLVAGDGNVLLALLSQVPSKSMGGVSTGGGASVACTTSDADAAS